MADALNARQESFIGLMRKSVDHAHRGFELLSKRGDAARYFEALLEAGLLDPAQNPGPVAVPDKPGFVRIPYWRALDYLEALARQAGANDDVVLANKVLGIVQAVTAARQTDGSVVDNHYTFWKFAEILGHVPITAITDNIIALVPSWLRSRYDRSLAGHALSDGVMKRLLASNAGADLHRACLLLDFCTTFEWRAEGSSEEISTAVEDFWLRDMFSKHIETFGIKAGEESAHILAARVRAVFSDRRRPYQSSLWRPAVETHPQNYEWRGAENRFVEGLREIVLAWFNTGEASAQVYVAALLADDLDIMRRIALHIIDEQFQGLGHFIDPAIDPELFASPFRHELHRLLSRHFAEFSDIGKAAVVVAIRAIPAPKSGEKRELYRKHIQRDWLSAIVNKGYEPADVLFAELNAIEALGSPSDHPDFLSYHETRVGPGPSPFTIDILIAAGKEGTLLEKIGSFREHDSWRGPTEEGLWDALQATVAKAPDVFLGHLDRYLTAPIPVIHAIIAGLRTVLDTKPGAESLISPSKLWPSLLDFFERVLAQLSFWIDEGLEPKNLIARRSWVLSAIADALASGTRIDNTAYAPRLLPQGWRIILVLLARAPGMIDIRDSDVMTQAINTPRGRVIQALVNHALRVCRIETKKKKEHAEAWAGMQGTFDEQLALCHNGNFEFSALMAHYVANMDYLSPEWLETNFDRLFDPNVADNFRCALAGLPYATLTRRVYRLLADHNVVVSALDTKVTNDREGHRIVEFMCLALLWGDEALTSARFCKLFEGNREGQLVAATDWFWSVRGDKLTNKQRKAILAFWSLSAEWSARQAEPPKQLLSHLGRLAVYLSRIDAKGRQLLEAVAPYVGTDYNFHILVEQLDRLAPENTAAVTGVLGHILASNKPDYDMEDRFKNLLRFLAAHGHRAAVLGYIEQLMPGMLPFFEEISQMAAP
ncbi:MAG TPA: hypothetical protein VGL35_11515 [Rhizomicrobium sp.]|jgi:hypothetical protein